MQRHRNLPASDNGEVRVLPLRCRRNEVLLAPAAEIGWVPVRYDEGIIEFRWREPGGGIRNVIWRSRCRSRSLEVDRCRCRGIGAARCEGGGMIGRKKGLRRLKINRFVWVLKFQSSRENSL